MSQDNFIYILIAKKLYNDTWVYRKAQKEKAIPNFRQTVHLEYPRPIKTVKIHFAIQK